MAMNGLLYYANFANPYMYVKWYRGDYSKDSKVSTVKGARKHVHSKRSDKHQKPIHSMMVKIFDFDKNEKILTLKQGYMKSKHTYEIPEKVRTGKGRSKKTHERIYTCKVQKNTVVSVTVKGYGIKGERTLKFVEKDGSASSVSSSADSSGSESESKAGSPRKNKSLDTRQITFKDLDGKIYTWQLSAKYKNKAGTAFVINEDRFKGRRKRVYIYKPGDDSVTVTTTDRGKEDRARVRKLDLIKGKSGSEDWPVVMKSTAKSSTVKGPETRSQRHKQTEVQAQGEKSATVASSSRKRKREAVAGEGKESLARKQLRVDMNSALNRMSYAVVKNI